MTLPVAVFVTLALSPAPVVGHWLRAARRATRSNAAARSFLETLTEEQMTRLVGPGGPLSPEQALLFLAFYKAAKVEAGA